MNKKELETLEELMVKLQQELSKDMMLVLSSKQGLKRFEIIISDNPYPKNREVYHGSSIPKCYENMLYHHEELYNGLQTGEKDNRQKT